MYVKPCRYWVGRFVSLPFMRMALEVVGLDLDWIGCLRVVWSWCLAGCLCFVEEGGRCSLFVNQLYFGN